MLNVLVKNSCQHNFFFFKYTIPPSHTFTTRIFDCLRYDKKLRNFSFFLFFCQQVCKYDHFVDTESSLCPLYTMHCICSLLWSTYPCSSLPFSCCLLHMESPRACIYSHLIWGLIHTLFRDLFPPHLGIYLHLI